jgi:nitroimidazol reductase NimA-like FMN-containing flavoprotein (pyridoxamine 5'-phosphate oxidase superfamily)
VEDFDWKNHLVEALEKTDYCSISTVDKDGSWVNPVYFAYDEKFNLYFVSMPSSKHMKNISNDNRISVAIYSTAQDTHGDVLGVQLKGKATLVKDEEVPAVNEIYYKRVFPDGNHNKKPEDKMGNAEWKFVKIVPDEIYYFDTRYFGEERKQVPTEQLA